jgi:prepilin-type N-terminal cleavage/methylation domain-containing protein
VSAPRRHGDAGFTLIEMVIGIALLALLTTILIGGFRLETQHVGRISSRLDRAAELQAAHTFLRTELASAQSVRPVDASGREIMFEGASSGLEFVAVAPQSAPKDGLDVFTIMAADGALRVRWRRYDGLASVAGEHGDEATLVEGVERATFRYFGIVPPATAPAWHDSWRGMPYLPSLVRLDLVLASGESAPGLTIAPRLAPSTHVEAATTVR